MKVLMVSGSWPPEPCGVGHYASRLSEALAEAGIDLVRFGGRQALSMRNLHEALGQVRNVEADIVHLQYPTMAYGRSFAPPLFTMLARTPVVVTLHEFDSFRFYRLPWFLPYALFADALVFTTAFERDAFRRRLHRIPTVNEIIPIGSNIPTGPTQLRRPRSVCYFGLIMPDKGLEQFIELMQRLSTENFTFTVIGSIPHKCIAYGKEIVSKIRTLGGLTVMNAASDVVALQLRQHSYIYLPFPDGATDKRGSLLAALVNGLTVLAPLTDISRPPITEYVVHAGTPHEAASLLREFEDGHRSWKGGAQFAARSDYEWHTIAQRHQRLYETVLARRKHVRSS
jgi:glycosyltransferase involved in cell wall biosynthesis